LVVAVAALYPEAVLPLSVVLSVGAAAAPYSGGCAASGGTYRKDLSVLTVVAASYPEAALYPELRCR